MLVLSGPNNHFKVSCYSSYLNINQKKHKENSLLIGEPIERGVTSQEKQLHSIKHLFIHFSAGLPLDNIKPYIKAFIDFRTHQMNRRYTQLAINIICVQLTGSIEI